MKAKKIIKLLILTLILNSCSNDSNDNSSDDNKYYIKAKINGENINLSYYAQATLYSSQNNDNSLQLYAGTPLPQTYPFFVFEIDNLSQVVTGVYNNSNNITLFQFLDRNQKTYGDYYIDNSSFSLEITEVSNTYIKGRFQGVLWEEVSRTETITVTEGEFYLPRYYNEYGNTTPNN